jgi:hypothetical protein
MRVITLVLRAGDDVGDEGIVPVLAQAVGGLVEGCGR